MYLKYCKIKNVVLSQCDTDVNNSSGAGIQSFHYSIIESSPVAHGFRWQQRSSDHLSQCFTPTGVWEGQWSITQAGITNTGVCISKWNYMQVTNPRQPTTKQVRHAEKLTCGTHWKQRTFTFQIFSPSTIALPAATFSVVPATSNPFPFSLFIIASPFQWAFVRRFFINLNYCFILFRLGSTQQLQAVTESSCPSQHGHGHHSSHCRAATLTSKGGRARGISGQDRGIPSWSQPGKGLWHLHRSRDRVGVTGCRQGGHRAPGEQGGSTGRVDGPHCMQCLGWHSSEKGGVRQRHKRGQSGALWWRREAECYL